MVKWDRIAFQVVDALMWVNNKSLQHFFFSFFIYMFISYMII